MNNHVLILCFPHSNRPTSSSNPLAPSSAHPTLLAPSLHPEHLFAPSPSPHCLAYLPSLSQPSVVMLYRAPDKPEQMPEGQRSPRLESEEGRKRRREEREEEGAVVKKKGTFGLEECEKVRCCLMRLLVCWNFYFTETSLIILVH